MKRLLLISLICAGCLGKEAQEAERRATDAERAREQGAAGMRVAEANIKALKEEIERHGHGAAAAERELRQLREVLVASWNGDPATLRGKISAARIPKDLARMLEQAQTQAGTSARERRFAQAVKDNALDQLGPLLAEQEDRAGFSSELDEEPAFEGDKKSDEATCERKPVEVSCRALGSEEPAAQRRFVCREGKGDYNRAVSLEDTRLVTRTFRNPAHTELKVVRSFANDWWVVRRDSKDPVRAHSAVQNDDVSARTWFAFFQLSADSASERLTIEGDESAHITFADLDGDRMEEVISMATGSPRAAHYDRLGRDVRLWSADEICAMPGALRLAFLAAPCADVRRKADERAAAAAQLAARIAQAPQPTHALEQFLDAVARCDLNAAKQNLSRALLASVAKEITDASHTEIEFWQDYCKAYKSLPVEERLARPFKEATVEGDRAEIPVKSDRWSGTAHMVFEDGRWKGAAARQDGQEYWFGLLGK